MTFLGLEARTDLPQVAYPTALDYFVFVSFMYIFSTVVQVRETISFGVTRVAFDSDKMNSMNTLTTATSNTFAFDVSTNNDCLFLQFGMVHYFTKVGAGEYYLEELEETVCEVEARSVFILPLHCRRSSSRILNGEPNRILCSLGRKRAILERKGGGGGRVVGVCDNDDYESYSDYEEDDDDEEYDRNVSCPPPSFALYRRPSVVRAAADS